MIIERPPLATVGAWRGAKTPGELLTYLESKNLHRSRAGRRQLRLFACACLRRIWHLFDDDQRAIVQLCERYADRAIDGTAMRNARTRARAAVNQAQGADPKSMAIVALWYATLGDMAHGCSGAASYASNALARDATADALGHFLSNKILAGEWAQQCDVLREIVGNPFQPVAPGAWQSALVKKLAERIYAEQAFADLPILADALEEAGCVETDLLRHCRKRVGHVRGCWALDLVRHSRA